MFLKLRINTRLQLENYWLFRKLESKWLIMSNKKRENKEIRNQYQRVTGSQLVQEGKLDPYHHLKDWVDILEERKQNQTDWWEKMTLSNWFDKI